MKTVEGHIEEDSVAVTPAMEEWLGRQTEAATESDARLAAAGVTGDEAEVGRWGPVIDWPVVGIHMALMPDGKVIAYDSSADRLGDPDQSFTRATVWSPTANTHVDAMLFGFNIFCTGLAHLMDGTLFTAGGNEAREVPRNQADPHLRPRDEQLESRARHGGGALVSHRNPAERMARC